MLSYNISKPVYSDIQISKPLPDDVAEHVLLNYTCHVDHEGFDLNEIEQGTKSIASVELNLGAELAKEYLDPVINKN